MTDTDDVSERAKARVGTVLRGKWHLDRIVGIGGTASVYAATHRNRSRVAIKMLHAEFAANRSIVQRFLREGYVGNAVAHPGTVQVLDDDVNDDGAPFLVMELLDGETLGDRIDRLGRLPVNEVATVGCMLLDVLVAAQAQNIVHRDLKPDNVFLTRNGQLKVLDFGIARLREAALETGTGTLQGSLLGTPGFMAPEQALGRWNEVDGRTDIWAVGATLFTLLTGRIAHEADSVQEQLVMAATRPVARVLELAPSTPSWLAAIIDRAMAFDAADRFQDARSMHAALRAHSPETELGVLSIPARSLSLAVTPQFPSDAATHLSRSETMVNVAHSTPQLPPRARGKSAVFAAFGLLAVGGIALALSAYLPKPPVEEPQGHAGQSSIGAGQTSAARSNDPTTAATPSATVAAGPDANGVHGTAEKPEPRVIPAARPPETMHATSTAELNHRKITKTGAGGSSGGAGRKPPHENGEKPQATDNPFDTRH